MSATIYWEPVRVDAESLYTLAPQKFMEVLEELGWRDGGTLSHQDIPALKALALTCNAKHDHENPYLQLVAAIETYNTVKVWAGY